MGRWKSTAQTWGKTTAKPWANKVGKQVKDELAKEARKTIGKHASPQRVKEFISKMVASASRGKSQTAKNILTYLGAGLAVEVSGGIVKLLAPPIAGVAGSGSGKMPMETTLSTKLISGHNALYNAKEHKVKFTSGNEPGSWLRQMRKLNGEHTIAVNNTTEEFSLVNPSRTQLVKNFGLNQKMQLAVATSRFGFSFSSLLEYFSLQDFDSSIVRTQVGYGAISNLTSKCTITSLNRYVPVYVKLSLLRTEVTNDDYLTAWKEGINPDSNIQIDGAMPRLYQQEAIQTNTIIGNSIMVDPQATGIRTSEKWKSSMKVIESKTVKLYAGDRIKLIYDHMCGSGIRLDKLHGCDRDNSWNNDHPITYSLMVESWGEEVDAYAYADANKVIKGTCPGSLQFEFSKHITGIGPSGTGASQILTTTAKGYISNRYAVKVYTKSPLSLLTRRSFGTYADLTATTGSAYRIPVMSGAEVQAAGKVETPT